MDIMPEARLAFAGQHGVLLRSAENQASGDVQDPSDVGVYPRREIRMRGGYAARSGPL